MMRSASASNGGGGGVARGQRLSPFDDDESGDESYDTFRSSSVGSSSVQMQIPAPASVPRPQRIKMIGTVLPQDSMRGNKTRADGKPFVVHTKKPKVGNVKLFAAAGLDLFRQGLAFDGLQPCHQAPRHPAVTPNLNPIQEDEENPVFAGGVSTESQVIVVLGAGPLKRRGEVSACVANRIEKASQLYWEVTKVYAEQQANSHCYLVPMAEESGKDGVLECEAIRNALAAAGISPHHILMDCSASSVIDNAVLLIPLLRHLHVQIVHVVTSQFHIPRVQACVGGILNAVADMKLRVLYHAAPDGFRATERARHEKLEHMMALRSQQALDDAVARVQKPQRGFNNRSNHRNGNGTGSWGVNSTRGASHIASQGSSALISNGFSSSSSSSGGFAHRGI